MKITDIKGEAALDALAEIIEPIAKICGDEEIANMYKAKMPVVKIVKPLIQNHKSEVIEILAILDGEDPKTYAKKVNLLTLPKKLLEVLNDEEIKGLFTY